MRCYTVDGTGLEGLKLVNRQPAGSLPPGHVRVDVHAISLNYRDLLVAGGQYGGVQEPAIIAASDMSGVVTELGPAVSDLSVGDRVLNAPIPGWLAGELRRDRSRTLIGGQGVDGVLAEQIVFPSASLVTIPEHLSFEEGATLTVAGLTAWAAVVTHGQTQPGQWVLIHGTGGVAIFAAQIASILGARIIQTTSSSEKALQLKNTLGVHHTLDYGDEDWPRQAQDLTGGCGVDVVVETAGGCSLQRSIQACGFGARIGMIGVLDSLESCINVFSLIMRQISVHGIYVASVAELRALAVAVAANELVPVIDRVFAFEDARAAYDHLKSQQHFGKVVIRVRD